jgi:hypothetical protein
LVDEAHLQQLLKDKDNNNLLPSELFNLIQNNQNKIVLLTNALKEEKSKTTKVNDSILERLSFLEKYVSVVPEKQIAELKENKCFLTEPHCYEIKFSDALFNPLQYTTTTGLLYFLLKKTAFPIIDAQESIHDNIIMIIQPSNEQHSEIIFKPKNEVKQNPPAPLEQYFTITLSSGTISKNSQYLTDNIPNSWVQIDLGPRRKMIVNHYQFISIGYIQSSYLANVSNWNLEASNDAVEWIVLNSHRNFDYEKVDEKFKIRNSNDYLQHWSVDIPANCSKFGFRYFRIILQGENEVNKQAEKRFKDPQNENQKRLFIAENKFRLSIASIDFWGFLYNNVHLME